MSHNITLKDVNISDLSLLGEIVHSLSNGEAALVRDAKTFRTYAGQSNICEHKITMPGRHDIGLRSNDIGGYTMIFDPYMMSRVFKHDKGRNYAGMLLQEYTLQEAEIKAAQKGFSSRRIEGDNGVVTLELVSA